MSDEVGARALLRRAESFLATADMARAYTLAAFGAVFSAFLITRLSGQVTYITIITALVIIGVAILVARRAEISLLRLVPSTLVLLMGWMLLSAIWSTESGLTVQAWLASAGLAVIAVVIGHVRDTLQTVRAVGDVLRVLLSLSLAIEVFSGILIDTPIRFLGVLGNLAVGGPVQGIFGTRNLLGFVALLAIITFVVEWRTSSVRPGVAAFSVVLAGGLAVFSDSPTVAVLAVAMAAATGALAIVRHTDRRYRTAVQSALGALVVIGLLIAYAARHPIIRLLNAGSDFSTRAELWNTVLDYVRLRPITGWGWYGPWATEEFPFFGLNFITDDTHLSALNAYFDVTLQTGWVGLVLFAGMAGIALVRSWLVASERRSVLYAWTPLILVALLVDSMFESFTLIGFGWLLLVLCVVRAGLSRSWRGAPPTSSIDLPPGSPSGVST